MSQTIDTSLTGDNASNFPGVWADFLDAIFTSHSGTSRPSYAETPTLWYNTSDKTFYAYDGTSDIALFTLDTTNHVVNPRIGGGTATLASGSTVDLGSVAATAITLTGTTTITSFGSSMKAGQIKTVVSTSALSITHNGTSLIIPGAANLAVDAGGALVVLCVSEGNYRVLSYLASAGLVTPTTLTAYAPLASPTFTGVPAAPTAAAATSTTQLATTAFVNGTALTLAAGTTAATQTARDDSTKVATTAYVDALSQIAHDAIGSYKLIATVSTYVTGTAYSGSVVGATAEQSWVCTQGSSSSTNIGTGVYICLFRRVS